MSATIRAASLAIPGNVANTAPIAMDSLSQIVLGSTVAALAVPTPHRRAALLAGAVLGTLPDLDSFPLAWSGVDAVTLMTWHRGPSHSLFVLALGGWLLWLALRRWWRPVREAPRRWLLAIQLVLITHTLLDAFTIYGTQLWWPLPVRPAMGGSMFIIDPLYTLPLLLGCLVATVTPRSRAAGRWLAAGLMLSTAYLGWSLAAQVRVNRLAGRELAKVGLDDAPRFATPAPFNTLLWRVVVMTPDGYLEGWHSLVADQKPIAFKPHTSDTPALAAVADLPAVRRLMWFNHGFMKAEVRDDRLVLSDLRMGSEPNYAFAFVVAEQTTDGEWRALRPEPVPRPAASSRIEGVWTRLWNEP